MNAPNSQRHALGPTRERGLAVGRLLYWLGLTAWAIVAFMIAQPLSDNMRVRINDLGAIPGAGEIMRDPSGIFYHVNTAGRARAIFPKLAPAVYEQVCLDCALLNGDQLSQTADFCITGVKKTLPNVQFEIPCRTWTPMGESHKVLTFIIFITPILAFWLFRAIIQRAAAKKKKKA